MRWYAALFLLLYTGSSMGSFGSSLSSVEGFGESIGSTTMNVVNGFKSMGGAVPSGYTYSFCVINGCAQPVMVKAKGMKDIMGAQFAGSIKNQTTINPGTSSGTQFNKISLYFEIEFSTTGGTFFSEKHYQLGVKNDPATYMYHTYQDQGGNLCGEEVGSGYVDTSAGFMSVIYNNTANTVPVSFSFGTNPITINLEPQSWNYLTDVASYAIRPTTGSLNFGTYGSVVVGKTGMGQTETQGQQPGSTPSVSPAVYNYEIYGTTAFESGMAPGNFAQPTTGAIRSITPMPCYIWNQSAEYSQATFSQTLVPAQIPGQSVWLLYTGPGYNSNTQKIEQPFIGQIPYGQTVEAFLIRPTLQDYYGRFYLVRLNTTDVTKAQAFLQSIAAGTLTVPQLKVDPTVLAKQTVTSLIQTYAGILPDTLGLLQDANGTQGYIMLEDVFLPYGLGSGPFYYSVPAPNYDVSQMFSTFSFLQAFTSSDQINQSVTNFQTALTSWIQGYASDPVSTQASMQQFLLANGTANCIAVDKNGNKSLTPVGMTALNMMLYGPASMTQLPVCYQVGQNYQNQAPDGFPTTSVSFPVISA